MSLWMAPLALAAGGAAFALAELAARGWTRTRGRCYVWMPGSRVEMHLDREVLPDLEPVARHAINAHGERGGELPADRRGLFRVLVAGGSAAECHFIDQPRSWPQVLQQRLSEPPALARLGARRVHVGSIARSLVTCRHVDAMLEQVLPHAAPLDAVVFMVGASDVVHWLEQRAPALIVEGPIRPEGLFALHCLPPFGWGPRALALRRQAAYWRGRLLHPVERRARAGRRLGEARAMRARAREVLEQCPDPAPLLAHFERWFRVMVGRAQRSARHVLVVRQPWLEKRFTPEELPRLWNFGAGRPYQGEVTAYWSHAVAWELLRRVDACVERVCDELGVAQAEIKSRLEPSFDIFYDELHTTVEGNRQVGELTAEALLAAAGRSVAHPSTIPRA